MRFKGRAPKPDDAGDHGGQDRRTGRPQGYKQPTREFFEQSDRAAELRNVCIRAIELYEEAVIHEGQESEAMSELMGINSHLADMGVEPEMHLIAAGDPDRDAKVLELSNNPDRAAEYIAGQMRDVLIHGVGLSGSAHEILQEHDELAGEGEGISVLAQGTDQITDLRRGLVAAHSLREVLDYNAGPSEL